jgi:hypothetical protein
MEGGIRSDVIDTRTHMERSDEKKSARGYVRDELVFFQHVRNRLERLLNEKVRVQVEPPVVH